MRIKLESIAVSDQDHALKFYTDIMEFVVKQDEPMGDARLITLAAPDEPDGALLMLEPAGEHPATKTYKQALKSEGIPFTAFEVDDIHAEYARLQDRGVTFTMAPMDTGVSTAAILDDTCGNLIMIYEPTGPS